MIMDCSQYVGKCVCGREHTLETKKVVVEYNAIANFEQYMQDVGLAGKRRTVVYDSNIYKLTEGKHIKADQEIVLPAAGLRSEDVLIEDMMKQLEHPEVIVAYGAGTIMDFGRYPAYKLGIPFVAVPTLASSDGFTASICSVILNGQKKSITMKAPVLVVADLDIIKGAPMRLVSSGINDILAKYISLADWRIAALVAGEDFCPMVAGLAEEFGPRLHDGIMKENEHDVLATFDPQNIVDNWDKIRSIIAEIPSAEEMEALYKAVGSKYLPEHIGIDPALTDEMLPISAAIRNRLTLVRMLRVLDFE